MYRYQYEVIEHGEGYTLGIYDSNGRKHFTTDIDEEDYKLYEEDEDKFANWIEETFDDVLEGIK